MDWVSLAVAAGTGAVAALAAMAVLRLVGREDMPGAKLLQVVIFVLALALGRSFIEPRVQAWRVESALLELSVYRALQQHEPQTYARVRQAMQDGVARRLPKERIWAETRPVLAELLSRRLPHARDEVVVRYMENAVSVVTLLQDKGGDACFSYLNPAPGEAVDFLGILGKDVMTRELDLGAEVLSSAAGRTRAQPSAAEVQPDLEAVIGRLLQKYTPQEVAVMENPAAPQVDKRKYCQLTVDMYRAIFALPPEKKGPLLRYLLQDA